MAIAPVVFLGWFVYVRDRYEPEPRKLILETFLLGALLIVPVVLIELLLSEVILESLADPFALFLYVLIGIALVEESSKFATIRLLPYRSPHLNELMDGIVYGAVAGLGFATPENIMYVLSSGLLVAILRALLSVPGHALWGATIGYYLAAVKFGGRRWLIVKGWGISILLHAVFDFAILYPGLYGLGFLISIGVIMLGWFYFFKFSRRALRASPFKPHESSMGIVS